MKGDLNLLKAKFDELVDRYDNGDDDDIFCVEEVNFKMSKYCFDFIDAGFDKQKIVEMLSPYFIWDYRDGLSSRGVKIDVSDLLHKFSDDFIREHVDELVNYGVDIDAIVSECRFSIDGYNDINFFLEKGANAKLVFELAQELFDFRCFIPKEAIAYFVTLRNHGLPVEDVEDWINSQLNGSLICNSLICSLIESDCEIWIKIGVNVSNYIDDWLENYAYDYINHFYSRFERLPKIISIEKLVDYFTMDDILTMIGGNMLKFAECYKDAGGDESFLVNKFIKEIGYNSEAVRSILDLILVTLATDFDLEKVGDCVKASNLSKEEKKCYFDDFVSVGIPFKLISSFLPFIIAH